MPALDNLAILYALQGRLLTLEVTRVAGTPLLEATATGYSRSAGSFVDDGFKVGMEVQPIGFINSEPGLVDGVSALALSVEGGRNAEAAAPGRQLSVGLPAGRAWENVEYRPQERTWYVDEDYLPGPSEYSTLGQAGRTTHWPVYVLTLYGVADTGPEALYKLADAVLRLFRAGTAIPVATGDVLRVRSEPAPFRGQVLPSEAGRASITVTIPLWLTVDNI
jgi:hypothetical protein